MSSAWLPARGLRKGCSTFHSSTFTTRRRTVMRHLGEARAAASGSYVGVKYRWIPGNAFVGTGTREINCREVKEVRVFYLFVDDTTIVGIKEEKDTALNAMKK